MHFVQYLANLRCTLCHHNNLYCRSSRYIQCRLQKIIRGSKAGDRVLEESIERT
nr:unnamed protein product [Callosobruchus chinensis]